MIEKKRTLHLFHLLSNASKPQTSAVLAQELEVSVRTLKSDMLDLREFAHHNGAELKSRKNLGYWIEVTDDRIFRKTKKQLDIIFLSNDSYRIEVFDTRTNVILRKLLISETYIKIDDISDALYLTKSSIKNELKEVRRVLSTYNLKLETRPGLGNLIVGAEFDKRMCMLRVYQYHYYEAEPLFDDEAFTTLFQCDRAERTDIRHIFNEVMRDSGTHILDNFLNWVVRYLTLMRNRYRAGLMVVFDDRQREYLRKYIQYDIARDIIDRLHVFNGFRVSDDEIIALAIILMMWNDLPADRDFRHEYPNEYQEAYQMLPDIIAEIKGDFNIDISQMRGYDNMLMSMLIPIVFQVRFSCEKYSMIYGFGNDEIRKEPLSAAIAMSVLNVLTRNYKCHFSMYNIVNLAIRICSMLNSINYTFRPLRGLICSVFGVEASEMIKESVLNNFMTGTFEKLDTYELFEMRKLKREDYDFVMVNIADYVYKYDWPHCYISLRPSKNELKEMYNRFIVNRLDIEAALTVDDLKNINVYRNFTFDSVDTFVKMVSFKLARDPDCIEAVADAIRQAMEISIYNDILVVFLSKRLISRDIIDIYELNRQGNYSGFKFSYIVILGIDCQDQLIRTKFFDDFSRVIMGYPEVITEIMRGSSMQELLLAIKKNL